MAEGLNRHPWEYNNELHRAGVDRTVVGATRLALESYQAARRQRRRIWSKGGEGSMQKAWDGHFYAIEVVHAMRAAGIVRKATNDSELGTAIKRFESRASDYKNVRDILEHWDAYMQGRGRLQKAEEVPRWLNIGRKWTNMHVSGKRDHLVMVGPFELSVETSFDALRDVVRATCAVADRLYAKRPKNTKKQP